MPKEFGWFSLEKIGRVYQITNTEVSKIMNFLVGSNHIAPEIRIRIGLKLQNGRLNFDLRKIQTKQLLTEKDVKILEELIMKKIVFLCCQSWEILICMDDTSMLLLGRKTLEVITSAQLICEASGIVTSHLPYLNFPNHESAMAAPRMGVK